MKRAVSPSPVESADGGARTLADVIYRRLKADILWGRLGPAEPLRSDDLRATYDIGISPLREALTRLTVEGHVVNLSQRGFRVAPLTVKGVRDVAEARGVVEGEALRCSIEYGDLAWETEIVGATHALTRTLRSGELRPEGEAWSEHHRRYHFALIAACDSEWLLRASAQLFDHAERHRMIAEQRRINNEASGVVSRRDRLNEHEELAKTVLTRDTDGALRFMRRHLHLTMISVIAALEGSSGGISVSTNLGAAEAAMQRRSAR